MNSDDDNRRLLLAAALCLGVLGIYGLVFEPGAPPPSPVEQTEGMETGTSTAGTELETAEIETTRTTTRAAGAATPEQPVDTLEFESSVQLAKETVPYRLTLTNQGGALESFLLPSYSERNAKKRAAGQPIRLADGLERGTRSEAAFRQMGGLSFQKGTTFEVPALPRYEVVEEGTDHVRYRFRTRDGIVIEREWKMSSGSFLIESAVTVRNESNQKHRHILGLGSALQANEAMKAGSGFFANFVPPADHLQALCWSDGSVARAPLESLEGESEIHEAGVRWVAADRQYFLSALVLRDRADASCRLERKGDVIRALAVLPEVELQPGEERRHKFTMYLGPKRPDLLTLADAELEEAIEYTIFGMNLALLCTFLLWILRQIHALTGSWGVSIMGLTFLVKLVLFPLNQRQGKSLRAMSALKPEMDKLKEKYGEDRQRFNEEMLKLYRTHNVNPAGGCLPILIQMPIWISLYRSLWVSVDLYQEGFLWISDLTTRDPYWVLPVLLVAVMFIQQRTLPTTMDPAQQKILQYFMPLMFGSMMAALPAGLCLYILTNTLLTIVQQHFINRTIGPPPGGASAPAAPEASA